MKNRFIIRICSLVVVFCVLQNNLYAWCPIAHYLIAREAAKEKHIHSAMYRVEEYANLPDYEESKEASSDWLGQQVTDLFCWSHAVQNTGKKGYTWLGIYAPIKPTYPDDGRYPGVVMQQLITKILDLRGIAPNSEQHWALMNTVNGFRAHNAADRVVHFGWFHGATGDGGPQDNGDAWVVHHGLKEVWADYALLEQYGYSMQITWDNRGGILTDTKSCTLGDGGTFTNLGFKGNAPLMHVAQTVFRKNRRAIMSDGTGTLTVQTVDEINDKLKASSPEAAHVLTLFQQKHWATWEESVTPFGIDLVADFTMYDENGKIVTSVQYDDLGMPHDVSVKIDPVTPTNLKAEYDLLEYYRRFTVYFYATSSVDQWKIWRSTELFKNFDDSVSAAKEWMFTMEELKLRHHK